MLLKNESIWVPTSGAELKVKKRRIQACLVPVCEVFVFLLCKSTKLPWLSFHEGALVIVGIVAM